MRRGLLLAALLGSSLALTPAGRSGDSFSALGDAIIGPQRVLVILATWGPQPFARDDAQRVVFEQTDAFYRAASFGKAWLTGEVTPWLRAFDSPVGCTVPAIRTAANAAAKAAGYDLSAYDRFVYLHPAAGCPWSGVTFGTSVLLNGVLSRRIVAHELGHTFGLPHANATLCRRRSGTCDALEYGDPYDTMGSGVGDFSANAKVKLGWITRIGRPAATGVYSLDPLERPSPGAQVFVVTTANEQYWIENRNEPARNEHGAKVADAGVVIHMSPSPDLRGPAADFMRNVLIADPGSRGRPELRPGDRFIDPGAFTLTVLQPSGYRAWMRFRWTDTVPPSIPRVARSVSRGLLRISWRTVRENGSGVAHYSVSLDGRAPIRFGNEAADALVTIGRAASGMHLLRVVAVDRAGNRSAVAIQRFRVR